MHSFPLSLAELYAVTVYGCDLSNHDWDRRTVSLAELRKNGISFVTHKATEGNWYRDPYLPRFAQELVQTPYPVAGTYHVLGHGINAAAQVDYWVSYVGAHFNWRHYPTWIWQLDCEPLDGYAAPTMAEILAAGQRLQKKYGVPASNIVVYAPKWVYGNSLKGLPYRLWASDYVSGGGDYPIHLYPGDHSSHWGAYSGQTPLILQFSSNTIVGGQHQMDADAIRVPNEAALRKLFTPVVPPQAGLDLSTMTPAERTALVNDIAAAVWAKQFTHADTATTKTTAPASSWLVMGNRYSLSADTQLASLGKAVAAVGAKVATVAVDAQAVASDIKSRLMTMLGGHS